MSINEHQQAEKKQEAPLLACTKLSSLASYRDPTACLT
jgi:hypothetical protein